MQPPVSLPAPELLAPAGDMEAMRAAVANGADAVYFGLSDFNARHRATNFTLDELPATMQFLHEHGVRGYVAFNTLIFSDELPAALDYLKGIVAAGADAVIVQDLGLVRLIHRLAPEFSIHGSTQMTLTEPRGVDFVRALGVERVILARELSVSDISKIVEATTTPVEVFIHGALCVAYSGQCLTSESLGGRSANRGQCAQACRQPYELIVDGEVRDLGDKAYLLSPQDLAAYDLIGDLKQIGVCSFKIEGRLKSAHYVAATTQTYRAAIDAAVGEQPFALTQQQEIDLSQSFSRGFTHGFLDGVNHQELVQGRFPKHRGVQIGTVVDITQQSVLVELESRFAALGESPDDLPLKAGDGVVFDEGHPEQDEQGGRVFSVTLRQPAFAGNSRNRRDAARSANRLLEITFGRGSVNLGAVSRGSKLWKTDDPALRRRLEKTYSNDTYTRLTPMDVTVQGAADQLLQVTVATDDGARATVTWDQPLKTAEKHPLTAELAHAQFGRLGGTPFELRGVTLIDEASAVESLPVMVPKSVLNDLRRRAVVELTESRKTLQRRLALHPSALSELRDEVRRFTSDAHPARLRPAGPGPHLSVLARSLDQLDAILNWTPSADLPKPTFVYCDFEEVRLSKDAVAHSRAAGMPIGIATPRVLKPGEEGLLQQIARCEPDSVLVRNLAALTYFKEHAPELTLIGDYALNASNELTAGLFAEQGLLRLVPSYDLNLEQLKAMLGRIDPGLFEVVLHQHMPMFHMEHCVFSHTLSNGKDFHDCGRPCDRHDVDLKDHVGESHPLIADVGCRNTVFNAHVQSAAPYVPQLREWGVRHFRVELLRETPAETQALLESYARVLAGRDKGPRMWQQLQVLNQLGVTRGTMTFE